MSTELSGEKSFSQKFLHDVSQVTGKMGFKLNGSVILNVEILQAFPWPSFHVHARYHHPPDTNDTAVKKETTSFTDITK